jgi:DNA damage-binding protein 1
MYGKVLMISVREQNLLSLAFHTGPTTIHGPVISMLALSPNNEIELYFRSLSVQTQSLNDLGKPLNVVITPQAGISSPTAEINYGSIPFSCPGARHVIPVGTLGNERLLLVVGDEYTVLYSSSQVERREHEMSSSSQSVMTSPRASAISRSPQSELKQIGKRRKSSTTDSGGRWQVNPIWRLKQGFGTILS